MILDCYIYERHIGIFETTSDRGVVFRYDEDAPYPISVSMPVRKEEYGEKDALPFFSGLLPEGSIREWIAKAAHVPETSTIRLLERYGGEIAGAMIIASGTADRSEAGRYQEIDEGEIARRIAGIGREPLLLWKDARLSLSGAMDKVPLLYQGGRWFLPVGSAPSNVILKAGSAIAYNEFISTGLARLSGLPVPKMELHRFGDETALISYRYDRTCEGSGYTRLHQEDLCQVLSVMPERKYEEDGGPGVRDILEAIIRFSVDPIDDSKAFLRAVIFSYLIGNADAHAKNYSFLHIDKGGHVRLAPFYDIACTTIYSNLSRNLAMRIGRERRIDRITASDFLKMGMKDDLMLPLLSEMRDNVAAAFASFDRSIIHREAQGIFDSIRSDAEVRLSKLASSC